MPRYALTLAYDGTDFHGWQKQFPPGGASLRTVQGVLEQAVRSVVREPVEVGGASRTDAGVHALGQVAAFTSSREIPLERLPMAITSALPPDVQVTRATIVDDNFDPISDATAKGYRYRIVHGPPPDHWPSLFERRYVYRCWHRLDAARMALAATHLVGEHDFASFAHSRHGRESTVRRVLRCDVVEEGPHALRVEVAGTGFLYNMVRIIAGTLVEVGRGRIDPADIPPILAARNRVHPGDTLPPEGLCLMWVEYPAPTSPRAGPRGTTEGAPRAASDPDVGTGRGVR